MQLSEIDEALATLRAKPSTPATRRIIAMLDAEREKLAPTLYVPVQRQPKTIDDLTKNRR